MTLLTGQRLSLASVSLNLPKVSVWASQTFGEGLGSWGWAPKNLEKSATVCLPRGRCLCYALVMHWRSVVAASSSRRVHFVGKMSIYHLST